MAAFLSLKNVVGCSNFSPEFGNSLAIKSKNIACEIISSLERAR